MYRTSNYTVPMTPGHEYRVSFDYQNALAGEYNWVGGYASANGTVKTQGKALPRQLDTARFTGHHRGRRLRRHLGGTRTRRRFGGADFSLDNLLIEEMDVQACSYAVADRTHGWSKIPDVRAFDRCCDD